MGIASTIAPYILPKMFKHLSKEHPDIDLYVEEARIATIIQKLERAELDLALLATPLNNNELLEIPIYTERFVAYVSPNEHIYQHEVLDTSALPIENVWVLREAYCPNHGIFPFCQSNSGKRATYEAGSIETLVKIVDENGTAVVLESLVEGRSRKEIAAEHHVSENTIKTHISHIYEKFEVSSRESLMALLENKI